MTDLQTRFKTLDDLSAPNLWYDIQERAMAMQPTTRRSGAGVLIAVTLLLVLAIGGAALVGSGIVKLPATVDASASPSSANPSSSAQESTAASSSPIAQVPASWTATGNLVEARSYHSATLLPDGSVLVAGGGGSGQGGLLATAELYDPASGSWTATGSMNGVRILHTATLLADGRVLVAGGADGIGETSVDALATAELYDPATGSWAATGPMIEARAHHTATLLADGKVLVVGGSGSGFGSDSLASAELYDPATGSWTATSAMIEARTQHTATLLPDGRVLVAGGNSSSGPQLASAELYDPATGSWTATGKMVGDHAGHMATLLPDDRVLVLGGSSEPPTPSPTATAELYDPRTGSWTAAGSMNGEHYGGTATLLDDGSVLVAGGSSSVGSGGEELYEPGTGSWTAAGSMNGEHYGGTATLLDDGSVLVAGGVTPPAPLATAELYDPGSGG
jgi:hypothetical protein